MSETEAGVLVLRSDVVGTVIEDGAVLLDLETNYFFEVNATGWAILQLFEAGATHESVLQRCRQWGAPPGDIDAVVGFLDRIMGEKLLVESEWPASTSAETPAVPWSPPTLEKAPEALQRIMRSAFDPTLPLAE